MLDVELGGSLREHVEVERGGVVGLGLSLFELDAAIRPESDHAKIGVTFDAAEPVQARHDGIAHGQSIDRPYRADIDLDEVIAEPVAALHVKARRAGDL